MRERLEQIGRELVGPADEPAWMPQTAACQVGSTKVVISATAPGMARCKIERVLLIDDDEDQFLNLRASSTSSTSRTSRT